MELLLPCPFCGAGTTRVVMNGQTWTGTKYSDPISVSVVHHCDPIEGQPSRQIERIGRDAESAIAAWNRRASLSDAEAIIAEKVAEILEQCRINGMGAEREAALLGKVAQQSAALKLARQVLISVRETSSSTRLRRIVNDPLSAINEVLGE